MKTSILAQGKLGNKDFVLHRHGEDTQLVFTEETPMGDKVLLKLSLTDDEAEYFANILLDSLGESECQCVN